MHTLQKPNGSEEESSKSSTCQPGSVSIKYSDMLLVELPLLAIRLFPPLLFMILTVVVVVEIEFL